MSENLCQQFCTALRESLESRPLVFELEQEWRVGFDLARRCQSMLRSFGYDAKEVSPEMFSEFIETFADEQGYDPELLAEHFFDSWARIDLPEGIDPVAAAAEKPSLNTKLHGPYPTPRFKRDAVRVLDIAYYLGANDKENCCYLPVRKLADLFKCDKNRMARIIRALVANGHLKKVGTSTMYRAQRYLVTGNRKMHTERQSQRSYRVKEEIEFTEETKESAKANIGRNRTTRLNS